MLLSCAWRVLRLPTGDGSDSGQLAVPDIPVVVLNGRSHQPAVATSILDIWRAADLEDVSDLPRLEELNPGYLHLPPAQLEKQTSVEEELFAAAGLGSGGGMGGSGMGWSAPEGLGQPLEVEPEEQLVSVLLGAEARRESGVGNGCRSRLGGGGGGSALAARRMGRQSGLGRQQQQQEPGLQQIVGKDHAAAAAAAAREGGGGQRHLQALADSLLPDELVLLESVSASCNENGNSNGGCIGCNDSTASGTGNGGSLKCPAAPGHRRSGSLGSWAPWGPDEEAVGSGSLGSDGSCGSWGGSEAQKQQEHEQQQQQSNGSSWLTACSSGSPDRESELSRKMGGDGGARLSQQQEQGEGAGSSGAEGGDGVVPWDVELHLPLWVADQERQQIEAQIDGWVEKLLAVGADVRGLAAVLRKPLRPLWVSQSSLIWTNQVGGQGGGMGTNRQI